MQCTHTRLTYYIYIEFLVITGQRNKIVTWLLINSIIAFCVLYVYIVYYVTYVLQVLQVIFLWSLYKRYIIWKSLLATINNLNSIFYILLLDVFSQLELQWTVICHYSKKVAECGVRVLFSSDFCNFERWTWAAYILYLNLTLKQFYSFPFAFLL